MDNNNNPLDAKVDLTEVTNKAYDDTLHKPLKSTSNAISTVIDFFHNTLLYPMQKYNLYASSKLKEYVGSLENKVKEIPSENFIPPRINILGPAIEGLKYNLEEEHIKDMFTKILISDMDKTKRDKVLPAYIEIVKQLSNEDAKLLQIFYDNYPDLYALKLRKESIFFSDYEDISDYIVLLSENDFLFPEPYILDNLLRLKIIDIPFKEKSSTFDYVKAFHNILNEYDYDEYKQFGYNITYISRIIAFTTFGNNFLDICLGE